MAGKRAQMPLTQDDAESAVQRRLVVKSSTSTMATREITTHLLPDDVLMGRGAFTTEQEGNKRLRQLVLSRRTAYSAVRRHKEKQKIVADIVQAIRAREGRFLRRLEDTLDGDLQDSSRASFQALPSWEILGGKDDEKVIVDKVKQLLRDADPVTALKRKLRKRKGSSNGNAVEEVDRKSPNAMSEESSVTLPSPVPMATRRVRTFPSTEPEAQPDTLSILPDPRLGAASPRTMNSINPLLLEHLINSHRREQQLQEEIALRILANRLSSTASASPQFGGFPQRITVDPGTLLARHLAYIAGQASLPSSSASPNSQELMLVAQLQRYLESSADSQERMQGSLGRPNTEGAGLR
jgi:hypothetical protein